MLKRLHNVPRFAAEWRRIYFGDGFNQQHREHSLVFIMKGFDCSAYCANFMLKLSSADGVLIWLKNFSLLTKLCRMWYKHDADLMTLLLWLLKLYMNLASCCMHGQPNERNVKVFTKHEPTRCNDIKRCLFSLMLATRKFL